MTCVRAAEHRSSRERRVGRPIFFSRQTRAHAPGARLIGAAARAGRRGCRCLARLSRAMASNA